VDIVDILLVGLPSHVEEHVDETVQQALVVDQNIIARNVLNQRKYLLAREWIWMIRLNQLADRCICSVLLRNKIHLNCQSYIFYDRLLGFESFQKTFLFPAEPALHYLQLHRGAIFTNACKLIFH